MKFLPNAIFAICALYSVASATEAISSSTSRQLDTTYPVGTPVSYYEDNQWYDGIVQAFQNGIYTIKWEDEDEIEEVEAGFEMNQMVEDANGDDDAPPDVVTPDMIAIGTPAFIWEDGEWFDGEITDHTDGEYTVTWSDGDVDTYEDYGDDLEELMQAIQDALGDDDEITDDDDNQIVLGNKGVGNYIDINYDDATDDAAFDDDDSGEYDDTYTDDATGDDTYADDATGDNANVDDATGDDAYVDDAYVDDATGDDNTPSSPTITVGTPVSIYEDGAWIDGEVTEYSKNTYTVVWSEGTDEEYVDEYEAEGDDLKSLEKAVENAVGDDDAAPDGYKETTSKWAIDTTVRVEEDGSVWYGHIDDYSNGEYLIEWDDGESEWIDDVEIIRMMVLNAKASPKGMKSGGKAVLSLFLIVAAVIVSFYAYRGQKTRRSKQSRRRDTASETVAFKDRAPRGEASYYKKQSENLRIV
mmetsp:Transcript_3804/g.9191  ORF Transcript_3804/g.9191 Transcript_3804/m.9191 type:complete len:470 (+) Transcript_3804:82-1491(+)|eukprot:CAMPEP_0172382210 /NCGR_PEP_ID=MMETSP1061-20121228/189_1 /TAXON_ID=37318 /ORGANISM="Pseudo-nitzschia pungens, Strain cf. pungens" /LENGTH=469 /DNA_ID=CAMNT_0013110037 /DNA_START=50 /DNA_END=1459 /DNA_ORIENTATION=-